MVALMGNARDAVEERRLRRKGENAEVRAPRRRPSSWRRRKKRAWESIWRCSTVKEALSNQGHSFFLSVQALLREEHAYYGSQGPLFLFDPDRLGLFLAYCAKGSNQSNFPSSVGLHHICMEHANRFLNFLSVPPDNVLHPVFWNISSGFILYHRKEFQLFWCLQSSLNDREPQLPRRLRDGGQRRHGDGHIGNCGK